MTASTKPVAKPYRRPCGNTLQIQLELVRQLSPPSLRHAHRAAVALAGDPAEVDQALGQGGAERATEMVAPLAPVEAGGGELAAQDAGGLDIDPELGEPLRAAPGEREGVGLLAQDAL